MLIKLPDDIRASEITPEAVYHNRRHFIQHLIVTGLSSTPQLTPAKGVLPAAPDTSYLKTVSNVKPSTLST